MSTNCFSCGKAIDDNNFGRQDTCVHCGFDTRACKNCVNYDTTMNNKCRENQAPRIVEKEKGNFCDWFKPREGGAAESGKSKDDLKSAADALFGGGQKSDAQGENKQNNEQGDAKAAAEALFKKK